MLTLSLPVENAHISRRQKYAFWPPIFNQPYLLNHICYCHETLHIFQVYIFVQENEKNLTKKSKWRILSSIMAEFEFPEKAFFRRKTLEKISKNFCIIFFSKRLLEQYKDLTFAKFQVNQTIRKRMATISLSKNPKFYQCNLPSIFWEPIFKMS